MSAIRDARGFVRREFGVIGAATLCHVFGASRDLKAHHVVKEHRTGKGRGLPCTEEISVVRERQVKDRIGKGAWGERWS